MKILTSQSMLRKFINRFKMIKVYAKMIEFPRWSHSYRLKSSKSGSKYLTIFNFNRKICIVSKERNHLKYTTKTEWNQCKLVCVLRIISVKKKAYKLELKATCCLLHVWLMVLVKPFWCFFFCSCMCLSSVANDEECIDGVAGSKSKIAAACMNNAKECFVRAMFA